MVHRSTYLVTAVVVAVAAVAACKEDAAPVDNSAGSRNEAKEYFADSVYPLISAAGSCAACHTPKAAVCATCGFILPTSAETYSKFEKTYGYIAAPQNSQFLNYIHKDDKVKADSRSKLSSNQTTNVAVWLGMEANARKLPGAIPRAQSLSEAYQRFAGCMSRTVWEQSGLDYLGFSQTDFDGPCLGCHSLGQGGSLLSANREVMFTGLQKFPYIQKLVVGRVDSDGNFLELIPARRFAEKGNESCPAGQTGCHPSYGLLPAVAEAIDNFVVTTLRNMATGQCGLVAPASLSPELEEAP